MRSYSSHGQTIDVAFQPFGVFLWLVGGFEVRVGGRTFHPKLTGIHFKTSTEFDFDFEGKRVTGVVRSLGPMWFLPRMRYAVVVAETEIARDIQTLHRWYLSYVAWGVCLVILLLALLGAIVLVIAVMKYGHAT